MAEKNNSLEKALSVLDLFQQKERYTLTEIIQETGYSIAAASRILNTLEQCNYIYQDRMNGGYFLSDKLYILGRSTNLQRQLINVVSDNISQLCKRSGFAVSVAIRDGIKTNVVLKEEPANTLSYVISGVDAMSLNCTATGKAIIAFSEDPYGLIDRLDMHKLTENTITNKRELRVVVDKIRQEGFSYDMEEVAEGLVCVAAPVLDVTGIAICSISVSGYKERMLRLMDDTKELLKATAASCEQLLH